VCSNFSLSWQSLDFRSTRSSCSRLRVGHLSPVFRLVNPAGSKFFRLAAGESHPEFRVASDTSFVVGRGLYLMGKSIARR